MIKKTVFFGPFIGEFAWELDHWQGWVREVCKSEFKDYRRIASSYNGRAGLYPDVDEFWPMPQEMNKYKTKAVQYLIKGWRYGLPGSKEVRIVPRKIFTDGIPQIEYDEEEYLAAAKGLAVEPIVKEMFNKLTFKLPNETKYFIPWLYNYIKHQNLEFGLLPSNHPRVNITHELPIEKRLLIEAISPNQQSKEYLTPTPLLRQRLNKLIDMQKSLVCIFPRYREHYKTRNWAKKKL